MSQGMAWSSRVGHYLVTLCLLAVGGLGLYYSETIARWACSTALCIAPTDKFIHEIALAFVIAGVLSATMELYNSDRHHQHLKAVKDEYDSLQKGLIKSLGENLLQEVYERQVPEKVFAEVDSELLRAEGYRMNASLRLTLEKRDLDSESSDATVCVLEDFRYTLKNISGKPWRPRLTTRVHIAEPRFQSECHLDSVCINNRPLSSAKMVAATVKHEDGLIFSYEMEEILPPDKTVDIEFVSRHIRYARDEMVSSSLLPADGFKLSACTPQKDLNVEAISIHPKDLIPTSTKGDMTSHSWELRHGLFPGQGVWFGWRQRRHDVEKMSEGAHS